MFLRITISIRLLLSVFLVVIMEPVLLSGINVSTTGNTPTGVSASTILNHSPKNPSLHSGTRTTTPYHKAYNCPTSAEERHQNNIIRFGVILPFQGPHDYGMKKVRPALEFAKDYILQETDMLRNYTLEFDYRDSSCSEIMAPLKAIDMYTTKSADVFIGPACNFAAAPVARFSYYWGIPILTAGALVNDFRDKKQYKLLTRVLGDYTKAGEFLLSILQLFKYRTVGLMLHSNEDHSNRSPCWFQIEALFLVMKTYLNPDLLLKDVEFFDENLPTNFEQNLKSLSQKCRGM